MRKDTIRLALVAALATTCSAALADDTLKLAVGQRGLWDTSISDVGQRAGIFKKHGLTLEILYTQGAGETQQAVISGSVEIGVGVGIMGVLSAYSKSAPVRIIAAEITGAGDLFWYVKADFADKDARRRQRQDDCVFDQRLLHPWRRHCLHQAIRCRRRRRSRPEGRPRP